MQELHLVGFTTDRRHLIFSSRQGAKSGSFLVPVDEELLAAVDGLSPDTAGQDDGVDAFEEEVVAPVVEARVDAKLSVREVQARLRAGVDVDEIAARAEVDPAWVERFAPPIRAEQQQIVSRALAGRMERPRAGRSSLTLRDAVSRAMAERDLTFTAESFASAWSSRLVGADLWSIEFTFSHRGRRRTVAWTFEAAAGRLTTSDRLASQIGFVAGDGDTSSRAGTGRASSGDGDGGPSHAGGPAPARRRAAKKKQPVKKKAATKKAPDKKKAPAKKKAAKKKAPAKKRSAKKKASPAARVAAARKDATQRLEQATAKRIAASKKAAQRKSASARKRTERQAAANEKAAARAAREAEAQRRLDEAAEAESSAARDQEAARAVAAAERHIAEERTSAARLAAERDAAERAAAATIDEAPDDSSVEPVDAQPERQSEPRAAPAVDAVERRPDQAVVRLRAPLPSTPPEDPAARVAARRARAAERSVSTAQFRSGSAVQAASAPVNGAGVAIPDGVRRRSPGADDSGTGNRDGRPQAEGRRTRTRQLRAR